MPTKTKPIIKTKSIPLSVELDRLKTYLRAVDPPIQPDIELSKNIVYRSGMIPSWAIVKMFQLAEQRAQRASLGTRIGQFCRLGMGGASHA